MELLSPAGDLKSFYAAVYNGADAVYLGLQAFNARIKADNFTTDNIKEVVDFAHVYGVKVYVTINILIKDSEVNQFLDTVRACVRAQVDAYIVQDLGMAKLLLATFPNIVLHASTQMGIHNLSGAQVLAKFGFRRVVLARETKLEDIKLIKQHTNLEIEYFVQGALCVAFSGNCYLSAIKNGNSGNRGKCLQLCRLPYKVFAGNKLIGEGFYLSAKDLCLMKRLQELAAAGVDCLKLEGRLKRASYVAQVTRSYRQALDGVVDVAQEKAKISALFSRGAFNEQAYLQHNFYIINPSISNHQGRKIGKVKATTRFKDIYKITLELNETIGQGDALRFLQGKNQYSVGVGNVNVLPNGNVEIFSKQNIPAGCDVYLLKSEAKEKAICDHVKYLPVDFYCVAKEGKPAQLIATCGNVAVTVYGSQSLQPARTVSVTYDQVNKQLSKLQDTKFRLNHLECDLDCVFITVAELNDLRRKVVVALEKGLLDMYHEALPKVTESKSVQTVVLNTPQQNFYLVATETDLDNVALGNFAVMLAPTEYSLDVVCRLITQLLKQGVARQLIYLNLPVVATEPEMDVLDEILAQCKIGIVANNYAHLRWVKQYKTIAGIGLNVYNRYTAQALLDLGCENFVWSLEQQAGNGGCALVSGYPALMTLCHCPVREVYGTDCKSCRYRSDLLYQDEKNNKYRLRRYKIKHCYFELYSEEKYLRPTNAGKIYDLRSVAWKSTK